MKRKTHIDVTHEPLPQCEPTPLREAIRRDNLRSILSRDALRYDRIRVELRSLVRDTE